MAITKGISLDTGELGLFVPYSQGFNIRTKEQRETYTKYLRNKQAKIAGRNHAFTFAPIEHIQKVIERLETKHCGYLLVLQTYMNYNGCLVIGQKKKAMQKDEMAKILNLKRTAFNDFYKKMILHEIIFEDIEKKSYSINQDYYFKGSLNGIKNVIKSYSTDIRELFKNHAATDLGILYKLIPYIHYRTNMLCSNPSEDIEENIEGLKKTDIADILGISRPTLDNMILKMRLRMYNVFATIKRGNKSFILVNPKIFYRLDGYPDHTLLAIFLAR